MQHGHFGRDLHGLEARATAAMPLTRMMNTILSKIDEGVLAKLGDVEKHYVEIEGQMNDPAVATQPAQMAKLAREHGQLSGMVESYRALRRLLEQYEQAAVMQDDPQMDPELRQMALEETRSLGERIREGMERTKEFLVMSADTAVGSVILEIRAGTGGEEAALFARDLYWMYAKYAERRNWQVEMMSFSPAEHGGFKEVILGIKGEGVWSALGYEGGGHRVQRVPETEAQGRIHTSAATVAVLPEPEEVEIDIKKDEVIEHVARAGGPGGQSVNKTSSAIKLEHIPTGITVSMQDEKSQHKNRAKAWRILRSRVYDLYEGQRRAERDSTRKNMIGSGDRSQRIRTYNFPQNRLTDHRINLSLYSLEKIILGDMDELIKGLADYDKQKRLENLTL
jgi:peptide chain release factor 1